MSSHFFTLRRIAAILFFVLIGGFVAFCLLDPRARELMSATDEAHQRFRHWADERLVLFIIGYIVLYTAVALSGLPIWWLHALCGAALGLWGGTAVAYGAAIIAACVAYSLSRWLFRDWFKRKIETKMAKIRRIEEMMNHNGIGVVMVTRIIHGVPFGLSNYAFGLTDIRLEQVFVGTVLGALPAILFMTTLGAQRDFAKTWPFWTILAVLHIPALAMLVAMIRRKKSKKNKSAA